MSVGRYLILGLLLDGPASGYELGSRASKAVAYFWPITRSHIYTELPKLLDLEYATAQEVAQHGVPDKRVYTATEAGEAAFRAWLNSFDDVTERARQPLQIQLYFAEHTTPEHLSGQLDSWEQQVRHTLTYCQDLLDTTTERPGRALTLTFAIQRAQADLAWITRARGVYQ